MKNLTQKQLKYLLYMGTWTDHVDRADTGRRTTTASSKTPAGSKFSCLVNKENMMS
jgi:hypothetical protein